MGDYTTNWNFYFFYAVGAIFSTCAYALLILGLVAFTCRPTPELVARIISIVGWVFAVAATFVGGAYVSELVVGLSSTGFERFAMINRVTGPYAWGYWLSIGSSLMPLLLWLERFRRPMPAISIAFVAMTPAFFEYFVRLILLLHQ